MSNTNPTIIKQKDKLNTTQKTNTMSNTNPTIIKQKDKLSTTQKTNTMSNTDPTIIKQEEIYLPTLRCLYCNRQKSDIHFCTCISLIDIICVFISLMLYRRHVREYQEGNQKWTIHRNWQYKVHKTKKNKNTTQYALDTTIHQNKPTNNVNMTCAFVYSLWQDEFCSCWMSLNRWFLLPTTISVSHQNGIWYNDHWFQK